MSKKEMRERTDAEKLETLAAWFDMKYPDDPNQEVQNDLRRIAAFLREIGSLEERLKDELSIP